MIEIFKVSKSDYLELLKICDPVLTKKTYMGEE